MKSIIPTLLACAGLTLATEAQDYDIVISNGRVIDPETQLDAIRNVGIKDGRIAAISEFEMKGEKTIDATGHVVSPGFIDLHAHGLSIGDYRMQAMQGVTTALELEMGILPIAAYYEGQAKKKLPINYGAAASWVYGRIGAFTETTPEATAEYFTDVQGRSDWKMDIADPLKLGEILVSVEEALDQGALGIGVNAGYAPGYGQKEYFELSKLAAKHGVATYTHVRYMSNLEPQSSFEAVKELIANSALTGAHMHICHLNSTSLRDIHATLELLEDAQKEGVKVTAEVYPYGALNTVIAAAFFTGDNWRERMHGTAHDFQLGQDRLTDEQLADYQRNKPGTFVTWHFLDENKPEELALLDASVTHPSVMIASDAVLWTYFDDKGGISTYTGDEWPLPDGTFSHPRSAGTFSKILRSYVRERGLLSLSEAIRKISLMPAQTIEDFVPQMRRKGRLQVGMDADVVVFDPATVADKATFENPNQPAVGFRAVLVNGVLTVSDSKLVIDAAAGRPIRREVKK